MLISNDENPGVSAISPLFTSSNSTNLVVCLPLPNERDISPVFNFNDASILFNRLDLG